MDKKIVRKLLGSEILIKADAALEAKRQIKVIAASGRADRVGDIVKVDGIQLKNYKQNPIVLYGHDHYGLPIAKAVDMGVVGGKLEMTFEFADAATYAFADTVYRLVKGGFIKGVSIGARILEAEWIKDDNERIIGRQYNQLELLEVSVVTVPADSKALITAVKSGLVSESDFDECITKSLDAALDNGEENHVQDNTVRSQPEDEAVMKEQLAAVEKRLEALEAVLKAQGESAAKSMEGLNTLFQGLSAQIATKGTPDLKDVSTVIGGLPGPAGDMAKQVLSMIEGMTKRLGTK